MLAAAGSRATEQVTAAELEARMDAACDAAHQLHLPVKLADESKYSGRELTSTHFARWLSIVRKHLIGETTA